VTLRPPKSVSVLWALSSPEVRRSIRRAHVEATRGVHRHELQTIGKDGKERTLEVVTSLLFSGERLPIVQAIARDVTEQKRFREELRAYARRAILAQEISPCLSMK